MTNCCGNLKTFLALAVVSGVLLLQKDGIVQAAAADTPDSGHLTSIHCNDTRPINDLAKNGGNWIGLYKKTTSLKTCSLPGPLFPLVHWSWSDGTPVDYTDWPMFQPSGGCKDRCVQLIRRTYPTYRSGWDDQNCNNEEKSICKASFKIAKSAICSACKDGRCPEGA